MQAGWLASNRLVSISSSVAEPRRHCTRRAFPGGGRGVLHGTEQGQGQRGDHERVSDSSRGGEEGAPSGSVRRDVNAPHHAALCSIVSLAENVIRRRGNHLKLAIGLSDIREWHERGYRRGRVCLTAAERDDSQLRQECTSQSLRHSCSGPLHSASYLEMRSSRFFCASPAELRASVSCRTGPWRRQSTHAIVPPCAPDAHALCNRVL